MSRIGLQRGLVSTILNLAQSAVTIGDVQDTLKLGTSRRAPAQGSDFGLHMNSGSRSTPPYATHGLISTLDVISVIMRHGHLRHVAARNLKIYNLIQCLVKILGRAKVSLSARTKQVDRRTTLPRYVLHDIAYTTRVWSCNQKVLRTSKFISPITTP